MIQLRKLKMQKVNLVSTTLIALLFSAMSCTIISCGKTEAPKEQADAKETQQVAAVEEAPKESLNDIMKRLGIDKRIRVEDGDKAPSNSKQAEAIVVFFDAMVRGNAQKLKPLLSEQDQVVLDDMDKSGQWKSATENISRVNVGWTAGSEPDTLTVLGFYTVGDNFAAQLWTMSSIEGGKPAIMTALPSPQKIVERLQGNKTDARIKQWLAINKEEMVSAKAPDEVIEIPQQDRSVKGESSSSGSGDSEPSKPAGPGRRKPGDSPVERPK